MPPASHARSIFVSYSSADRANAEQLVALIKQSAPDAFEIFIDKAGDLRANDIPSGDYWLPHLANRLHRAHAVLALVSKPYLNSDMCWFEGSTALAMGKLIPIKIDEALPDEDITEPFRQVSIPTLDVAALTDVQNGKTRGNSPVATQTFLDMVSDLKSVTLKKHPFHTWEEAEAHKVGEIALALQKAMKRPLPRKNLNWSRGELGKRQRFRFLSAIADFSNCAGETPWDAARRRALRALRAAPMDQTVRAAVLIGLVGELMQAARTTGGANMSANPEPWRWLGDLALPLDREISRFAYGKSGDIPNDVRETFQVLRQKTSGRTRATWIGIGLGLLAGTGIGVVLAAIMGNGATTPAPQRLGGPDPAAPQPLALPAPVLSPDAAPTVTASSQPTPTQPHVQVQAQLQAPVAAPPPVPAPVAAPEAVAKPAVVEAPAPLLFRVGVRGLEDSVRREADKRAYSFSWEEVYATVIAINRDSLCSLERRALAGEGGDPLNMIGGAEEFRWPSTDQILQYKAGPRACYTLAAPVAKAP